MAALFRRQVRRSVPYDLPQPDWGNPICEGLVGLFLLNPDGAMGWSETGQVAIPYTNTASTVTGTPVNLVDGPGAKIVSQSSGYICQSINVSSITSGVYSLFAAGSASNSGIYSALDDDNGTARRFQFRLNAGKCEFITFSSSSNASALTPTALTSADASGVFTMGAVATATTISAYLNRTSTSTAFANSLAPNANIFVGQRKNSTTQGWIVGGLQIVAIWNRALTDSEMMSLADNKWQLFRRRSRRILAILATSFSAAIAEPLTAADLTSAAYFSAAQVADILSAADARASSAAAAAATADNIGAAEGQTAVAAAQSAVADGLALADSTSSAAHLAAAYLDSLGLLDQIVAAGISSASSIDSAAAIDATSALESALAVTSDSLSAVDVVTAYLTGAIPPVTIDANTVSKTHWVTFTGGTHVVSFAGGTKVVVFLGGTRVVTFGASGTKTVVFDGGTKQVSFGGGTKQVTFGGGTKQVMFGGSGSKTVIF